MCPSSTFRTAHGCSPSSVRRVTLRFSSSSACCMSRAFAVRPRRRPGRLRSGGGASGLGRGAGAMARGRRRGRAGRLIHLPPRRHLAAAGPHCPGCPRRARAGSRTVGRAVGGTHEAGGGGGVMEARLAFSRYPLRPWMRPSTERALPPALASGPIWRREVGPRCEGTRRISRHLESACVAFACPYPAVCARCDPSQSGGAHPRVVRRRRDCALPAPRREATLRAGWSASAQRGPNRSHAALRLSRASRKAAPRALVAEVPSMA